MAYRKFKLVNSLGEEFPLTDKNFKQFLNNPSGLGLSKSLSGTRVGNRLKIDKRDYNMPSPSGEIIFYDDTNESKYDAYSRFIRFAREYPLKLYYYIPTNDRTEQEANTLYIECEVTQLTKSQVQQSGVLRVPVTFQSHTFWLSDKERSVTIARGDDDPGTFTFPLSFPFSFGVDPFRNIQLSTSGTLITPAKILIEGLTVNPAIYVHQKKIIQDIQIKDSYAACRLEGTYDYVFIDANDNNETIDLKYNGVTIANPAAKQDLTIADPDNEDFFLTFIKIRPGTSYITFALGYDFKGTVKVTWRDEYVSM